MTEQPTRPTGVTSDAMPVFAKVFVHDLPAMAAFYEGVFGLVRNFEHSDAMLGRDIDEIGYQAAWPGGLEITLISYRDSAGPVAGESVMGFTTSDIHALVARAVAAGGSIPAPVRRIDELNLSVAFILDPEGHINEVVQLDA